MQFAEIIPILKEISIFGGIPEESLESFLELLTVAEYKKGDIVFNEHEPATAIYVIAVGKVKISTSMENYHYTVAEFSVGDCFGETSMIGIQRHSATATALDDTKLIILSSSALNKLSHINLKVFSMLVLNIARESCRRLYDNNKKLRARLKIDEAMSVGLEYL